MSDALTDLERRHLRLGWCALLLFLSLGIVLEAFHGFKVDWYLSVANDTRRLLWRLAHTHGTLLGLVHLGFAATLRAGALGSARGVGLASAALLAATVLLPGGFLLGGVELHGGDPGRGVLLVPVGAACLFGAVGWTALAVLRAR
jgi:hypothetical protein